MGAAESGDESPNSKTATKLTEISNSSRVVFEILLEQGSGLATMFAVAGAAIALTAIFYYRAFGTLRWLQWQTLLALRVAAILLIVLLLFRPIFRSYKDVQQRRALIFLLDSSASMRIADDPSGVTRFQQAQRQLEKWWQKLQDDFDLRLIEFSERARPLESIEDLAGLTPDGKATSLSRALVAATQQVPRREDVEAVILLSDGLHNSARNPLEVAGRMQMVVHTVGVGAGLRSDASYRDVQVAGIDCPDHLMLNNIAKIKGSIDAIGLAGRVVKVVLMEDDEQVGEQELTLDDVEGAQEVTFDYRPTAKGRHVYTVRVPPLPEEKIVENNQRSAAALVVEPGIRVLYIEGTLRAEYGALVDRFLAKDPDLEFYALVQTRPNVFLKRSNMQGFLLEVIPSDAETIHKFDVFIIGDIDSSYLRPAQQELLIRRVREGAGLLMLGGYHSLGPGGYAGTPLGDVLPVRLGNRDTGQISESFLPTLTPDGLRHPIFANIGGFFPTQQGEPKTPGLPPLDGCTRVQSLRPGATALAMLGRQPEAMPVLAVQPLDKGRTAVFCGDTTRKWQQGPRANEQESPYARFWGQMVRWLAGRSAEVETAAAVVANTDKAYYEPEEPIRILAVVRNQEGQAANDAKVVAQVRGPAGQAEQVSLSPVVGPGGHYGGDFEPREAGAYQIVVEAHVDQLALTADKLSVEVGRPNLEFEKLDLNDKLLGQIAADAQGRYVHISTADHLIDQLDRAQRKRRIAVQQPLYSPPLCWVLFVGVLTTEWILRKRFQLR